jgi:hypothetical protein
MRREKGIGKKGKEGRKGKSAESQNLWRGGGTKGE